jgi:hypothetical protein
MFVIIMCAQVSDDFSRNGTGFQREKKEEDAHNYIRFLCVEESYWCSPDIDRHKEERKETQHSTDNRQTCRLYSRKVSRH